MSPRILKAVEILLFILRSASMIPSVWLQTWRQISTSVDVYDFRMGRIRLASFYCERSANRKMHLILESLVSQFGRVQGCVVKIWQTNYTTFEIAMQYVSMYKGVF